MCVESGRIRANPVGTNWLVESYLAWAFIHCPGREVDCQRWIRVVDPRRWRRMEAMRGRALGAARRRMSMKSVVDIMNRLSPTIPVTVQELHCDGLARIFHRRQRRNCTTESKESPLVLENRTWYRLSLSLALSCVPSVSQLRPARLLE